MFWAELSNIKLSACTKLYILSSPLIGYQKENYCRIVKMYVVLAYYLTRFRKDWFQI